MAVSSIQGGGIPLYLHVVSRILRDMRIAQQQTNSAFDYKAFKTAISKESLTEGQLLPLQQRLETLESFMVTEQTLAGGSASRSKVKPKEKGNTSAQGVEWDLLVSSFYAVTEDFTNSKNLGWRTHDCRSLMSLCHGWDSMFAL